MQKKKLDLKAERKYDFNIYHCVLPPKPWNEKHLFILSKDMQSALSTVPGVVQITELQGTILINKVVAKEIARLMERKRKK